MRPWQARRELRPPGVPRGQVVADQETTCLRCDKPFLSPDRTRVRLCDVCKASNGRLSRREADGPASFAAQKPTVPDVDGGF